MRSRAAAGSRLKSSRRLRPPTNNCAISERSSSPLALLAARVLHDFKRRGIVQFHAGLLLVLLLHRLHGGRLAALRRNSHSLTEPLLEFADRFLVDLKFHLFRS